MDRIFHKDYIINDFISQGYQLAISEIINDVGKIIKEPMKKTNNELEKNIEMGYQKCLADISYILKRRRL